MVNHIALSLGMDEEWMAETFRIHMVDTYRFAKSQGWEPGEQAKITYRYEPEAEAEAEAEFN
jgi:hypothetical protein